jgi:hypothetical protein
MIEHKGQASSDPWEAATYKGNERDQLRRAAKMSMTEKVRWLEKAHKLSIQLAAARAARNLPKDPPS